MLDAFLAVFKISLKAIFANKMRAALTSLGIIIGVAAVITVLAVGAGKLNDKGERAPMDVKKGDRVLYGKYSGTEVKLNDETFLIIHQDEILGILG